MCCFWMNVCTLIQTKMEGRILEEEILQIRKLVKKISIEILNRDR
jgi:hypothetical protein